MLKIFFEKMLQKNLTFSVPFMTNGGWPGHVIKDMKAACKGANVVCDMQIQFDSTGGSNLETPQEQINEWIQSVKNLL